ncbi:hypothetical protein MOKP43_12280 [Mycobacterium avium subsp. hominissuis]
MTVDTSSRVSASRIAGNSIGLTSSRMARAASNTRRSHVWRERVAGGRGVLMPRAASSSALPIMAVQSPARTRWSRPGQGTTSPGVAPSLPWITATGARSP